MSSKSRRISHGNGVVATKRTMQALRKRSSDAFVVVKCKRATLAIRDLCLCFGQHLPDCGTRAETPTGCTCGWAQAWGTLKDDATFKRALEP